MTEAKPYQEKLAAWKTKLESLSVDPQVKDVIALSSSRQTLAAQVFTFRSLGALLQHSYSKLDKFSSHLRGSLQHSPHKEICRLLVGTEKEIGYLLAELVWQELADRLRQGRLSGKNSPLDWEQYLESGLNPTALKAEYQLVISSAKPQLLKALKQVMDPSDPHLFLQTLQGPEESARCILPWLKPTNRSMRITELDPSNLQHLPSALPEECRRSLRAASVRYFLQCSDPLLHLAQVEKYLGLTRTEITTQALNYLFNIRPNNVHLNILRDTLRGQTAKLNQVIVTSAGCNHPLSKVWQEFLIREANPQTLLPLLVLHSPSSWTTMQELIPPTELRKILQNTLLPSLHYSVKVKDWEITEQMLRYIGTEICRESPLYPSPPADALLALLSAPAQSEEHVVLLGKSTPYSCLQALAALRTSPPRFLRDQLLGYGLHKREINYIRLSKKTPNAEHKFIQTTVDSNTKPQDLAFFAECMPRQLKNLVETFLLKLGGKETGAGFKALCWYRDKDQVSRLTLLSQQVIDSFPDSRILLLTQLTRCNLIQLMPELNPLLQGQGELLHHATVDNLQHLLTHGAHLGGKTDLAHLIKYQNTLQVLPILQKFGIKLNDEEFWHVVAKANFDLSLLPLVRSLLQQNAPQTADSEALAELTESPLIALLLEFKVLQPADTLDGTCLLDFLDQEDLVSVLCRINLPADHPILLRVATREPNTAWEIVQRIKQTTQAKENLEQSRELTLELF